MTSTWQDNAIGDSMIAAFNEVQDLSTSSTSLMSLSLEPVGCVLCMQDMWTEESEMLKM